MKIETSEKEWISGTIKEGNNGWGDFYSDCGNYVKIGLKDTRMTHLEFNIKVHIKLASNDPNYVGDIKEYPNI